MTDIAELLDSLAPRTEAAGDWNRVLRDADVERHPLRLPARRSVRLGAVAAVAAAIALVVSLWPTGGPGPTVLERALAAVGDGQVLHFVYESDPPKTLVELATGESTEVRAEHEVWFDPEAGARETERFQGVVQFDTFLGPDELSEHARFLYSGLGAGYRDALESGRAKVVGEDVVDGTAVYWIRSEDPSGARTHDVAVSRDTFAPAYIRIAQHGQTALNRIVSYETLEAGSAPLDGGSSSRLDPAGATYGPAVELADAGARIGGEPVWAGADLHGFPLEAVRELRLPTADGEVTGLSLVYGTPESGPHVEISQAATPANGLTMLAGVAGYVPPEGTALVAGTMVLLRSNGMVVTVHAGDEAMAVDVARSLQPYTG
jgi:hypothetical protein